MLSHFSWEPHGHHDGYLVVLEGGERYGIWESRKVVTTLRVTVHRKDGVSTTRT